MIAQDSLYVKSLLEKSPEKYKVLEGNFSREEIAMGMPAGDFDWWRVVNTFVNEYDKSGHNAAAFKHWFGREMPAFD
ncbi:hypothetical protein [Shinella sp.]|uniref:hypothetical protein n=1 Tax=Shinella sp. TaxID=1870904 RepID=UPI0040368C24